MTDIPALRLGRNRPRRRSPEATIQRAVFQHIRARGAPGVFAWHCPNGGYRRRVDAAILKSLGVIAGVPDILAIHNGRIFGIELKAPGGRLSAAQLATLDRMREAGAIVAVATGIDEALRKLENLGLLRGRAS